MAQRGLDEMPLSVSAAYEKCRQLAQDHYENFTLGSWFLPKKLLPHFFALYAFCRYTDNLGDEAEGDRLSLLDSWESELDACYDSRPDSPIMLALQNTIHQFGIPDEPFRNLIKANRIDQMQSRFATYKDLQFYCNHSANPVGRMVLHVLRQASEENLKLSDATCTALQLVNFWQDVRRDWDKGRIYIPKEDMDYFGYTEDELANGIINNRFRDLIRFQIDRAEALFIEGIELVNRLEGVMRFDVALFSNGGLHVIEEIRKLNYDVLNTRPVVSNIRRKWIAISTGFRLFVLNRV